MSEETKSGVTQKQDDTTTPAGAEYTQSTAANVDMTAIEQKAAERAERAAQAVVKDMLKQSGLDDSAIQSMLAEYKAKQTTPEQTIAQLTKERDEGFAERDAKISALEQAAVLKELNIPLKEQDYYIRRISGYAAEKGLSFADAAAAYIELDPLPETPPKAPATVTYGGTGKTPLSPGESDIMKNDYAKAAKNRNYAEMSRLTRAAHEKGINLT